MLKIPPIYFYIVWPILYCFLVVSIVLYMKAPPSSRRTYHLGLIFFWVNIGLNFLYLLFFFGLNNNLVSTVDLIFLVLTAWATQVIFFLSNSKYRAVFATLYLFYTLWLSFALLLMLL